MKTKTCRECGASLPANHFSTLQSRICMRCKSARELKKALEKKERALTRLTVKKAKTKTVLRVSDLKKKVQKAVNKYVRERDEGQPCMACQKPCKDGGDASHYVAQGSSGFLRYNLDNIWKCCTSCNRFKHGNLIDFRVNLVKKIGEERVKWLEDHRHETKRWTREELLEVLENIKHLSNAGKGE